MAGSQGEASQELVDGSRELGKTASTLEQINQIIATKMHKRLKIKPFLVTFALFGGYESLPGFICVHPCPSVVQTCFSLL